MPQFLVYFNILFLVFELQMFNEHCYANCLYIFPCCAAHGFFTINQKEESREQKRETNKFVKESVRAIIGVKYS